MFIVLALLLSVPKACYIPSPHAPEELVTSPRPVYSAELPENWDWRNVGGQSLVSNVLTQQNPNVCGSCWAEAATGALSDRFKIATNGSLQINLAPQTLLNFPHKMSGGSCQGGDDFHAAAFMHEYGIADDTCLPFSGVDNYYEASYTSVEQVRNHLCRHCHWNGDCKWKKQYRRYSVEEFGRVTGEQSIMAEIYHRGPVACTLDSSPEAFNNYSAGIITSAMLPHPSTGTNHVVVIAGYGIDDQSGMSFWVGRNSYGTHWGEGRGGGWFRLQRGNDTLKMESAGCSWSVPNRSDVKQAMAEYHPLAQGT